MKVVLFDGMNLIHRARNGFSKGDHALVYSFFRSFKPLLEKHRPDIAYFVLEGRPKHRADLYKEYKSNRPALPDSFWRQQSEILNVMKHMPVIQIRHKDYECDDVIANLAKTHTEGNDDVIIVSGDSDFIQVFDTMNKDKISIYHPIKKIFIQPPDYCYLDFKSLRGDVSDNIPGIKGVGEKTATKIINSPELMKEIFLDPDKSKIFERNKSLIRFVWLSASKKDLSDCGVEINYPDVNLHAVKSIFTNMDFQTMISEKYWAKFVDSFKTLNV